MSDEEISFAFDAARGGVIASVASEEIAILEGLVEGEIAKSRPRFSITTKLDLPGATVNLKVVS
jgi:hypothetical protein